MIATASAKAAGTTVIARPGQPPPARPSRRPRPGRGTVVADVAGAAASATAVTLLGFGRLAPMHGAFGFAVVDYLLFLILLAVLTGLSAGREVILDRLMTVLMASAAVVLIGALAFVVVFTFWHGSAVVWRENFWTQDMSRTGPLDPVSAGGISYAILGTAEQTGLALAATVPLGIACAVYIREVHDGAARFTRVIVEAMTALPSIVAGLFIYVAAVLSLGLGRSGLSASLAMGVMMLPVIIRAADEVLRLVPNHLREAALATGASQWRVVWHVVLPSARGGLMTAVILGTTRGIGEASPLLLTAGATDGVNANPLRDPQASLPLAAFDFVQSPEPTMIARGFATAAALMILVLVLFTLARIVGGAQLAGEGGGRPSAWERRRIRLGSVRDSDRFDSRHAAQAEARDAEAAARAATEAAARRAAARREDADAEAAGREEPGS